MKYLSILRMSETHHGATPPAAFGEAMGKLIEKNRKAGVLIDTAGLKPSRDGFRMRVAGGALTTTDGPFAESKEVIGGYAIMQADSREEIERLTADFLDLYRTRGDLLGKLGRTDEARIEFERAAALAQNARERELLLAHARACPERNTNGKAQPS